ncbi:MAG: DUF4442 domain-containing protein [Flavobacteriaceae bacterium]|nr:DUF4442 domain-containing protein [Flavobacteriaceae bacterium]
MKYFKIHAFLFFKLPLAWLSGVRVNRLTEHLAVVQLRYRWINQNPFNSIYFAALLMASELSTGLLVFQSIKASRQNMSMLVTAQNAQFFKKARGKIRFECVQGKEVVEAIKAAISSGDPQKLALKSVGVDSRGEVVLEAIFHWSIKLK